MNRRQMLIAGGAALATAALPKSAFSFLSQAASTGDWESIRNQFLLTRDVINMSGFFLASHPKPVRDAIEKHRRGLDNNPFTYLEDNVGEFEPAVRRAAAEYLAVKPDEFAMTDSTTMGLGTLYNGLNLRPGQEILTTEHDHWATVESLRLSAERTGAKVRRVTLYHDPAKTSEDEITSAISAGVRPETRIVAVTWVHSCTGVKIPVGRIADVIAKANANRAEQDRALLCVDGVHGFGIDNVTMADLRCDFFVAGCHKWLFGPRGTGLLWGRTEAWPITRATIPSFDMMWRDPMMRAITAPEVRVTTNPQFQPNWMTPGGFHSFEHRWALTEAFRFHQEIGKAKIAERIHALNRQCKEGLARLPHVKLYTPMSDSLSAGIICFDVDGMKPSKVVVKLRQQGIIASESPYQVSYARVSPSLLTSEAEVDRTVKAIAALG
jgi:isopenicillin-N epimerase